MFNIQKIQEKAIGLVGFRANTALDPTLTESRSGLIFENASAMIDVNVLNEVIPEGSDINKMLKEIIKGAFVNALNSIFSENDMRGGGLLYPYATEWENRNDISGFLGYMIDTRRVADIAGIVNRLLMGVGIPVYYVDSEGNPYTTAEGDNYAAESPIGTAKIYLFNSQMADPIASVDISTEENTTVIKQVNWYLDYYSLGGTWFIGYFTTALPSTPIAVNYNLSYNRSQFMGMDITPVLVSGADSFSFRPKDVEYINYRPALNLDITTGQDYTQMIVSNEQKFARLLQLGVAISVADMYINSYRSNRENRISKANAMFELDGNRWNKDYPEHVGLVQKYEAELARVKRTFVHSGIRKATLC